MYLHDHFVPSTKRKAYKGDRGLWKDAVRHQVHGDATVTINFTVVAANPAETRLVVQAPDKAARRQLVVALRKSKGAIRGVPALTKVELQVKDAIYMLAKGRARIEDRVDILRVHVGQQGVDHREVLLDVAMGEDAACAAVRKLLSKTPQKNATRPRRSPTPAPRPPGTSSPTQSRPAAWTTSQPPAWAPSQGAAAQAVAPRHPPYAPVGLPPRPPPPARRPPGLVSAPPTMLPAPQAVQQAPQGLLTEQGLTWLRAFLESQAPPQLPAPPTHLGPVTFPAASQLTWAQGLQQPLQGHLPGLRLW